MPNAWISTPGNFFPVNTAPVSLPGSLPALSETTTVIGGCFGLGTVPTVPDAPWYTVPRPGLPGYTQWQFPLAWGSIGITGLASNEAGGIDATWTAPANATRFIARLANCVLGGMTTHTPPVGGVYAAYGGFDARVYKEGALVYSFDATQNASNFYGFPLDLDITVSEGEDIRIVLTPPANLYVAPAAWYGICNGLFILAVGTVCTFAISPASRHFTRHGGSGTITVTASHVSCAWEAEEAEDWLSITAGSSGTGSGTVTYAAAANGDKEARSGTITVAGKTHTVTQEGVCDTETRFAGMLIGKFSDDVESLPEGIRLAHRHLLMGA